VESMASEILNMFNLYSGGASNPSYPEPDWLLRGFCRLPRTLYVQTPTGQSVVWTEPGPPFLTKLFLDKFISTPLEEKNLTVFSFLWDIWCGKYGATILFDRLRGFLDEDRRAGAGTIASFLEKTGWELVFPRTEQEARRAHGAWPNGFSDEEDIKLLIQVQEPARRLRESLASALLEALDSDAGAGLVLVQRCGLDNLERMARQDSGDADTLLSRFTRLAAERSNSPELELILF